MKHKPLDFRPGTSQNRGRNHPERRRCPGTSQNRGRGHSGRRHRPGTSQNRRRSHPKRRRSPDTSQNRGRSHPGRRRRPGTSQNRRRSHPGRTRLGRSLQRSNKSRRKASQKRKSLQRSNKTSRRKAGQKRNRSSSFSIRSSSRSEDDCGTLYGKRRRRFCGYCYARLTDNSNEESETSDMDSIYSEGIQSKPRKQEQLKKTRKDNEHQEKSQPAAASQGGGPGEITLKMITDAVNSLSNIHDLVSTDAIVEFIKVTSPFLVVELSLSRLEGTQLRALGLLSMFGFNITYEVRPPTVSDNDTSPLQARACSAIECRLLGHCYAKRDFTDFYCACFEGYTGADCGTGPLCPRASNTCNNGGICRQLGPAAVSCLCAPGYTGDLCETLMAPPECGIEECSEGCKDNTCDCNPRDNDANSARFDTRLQIMDTPQQNISHEILHQMTIYLKNSNITLEEDVEVINISSPEASPSSEGKATRTVSLRIWGLRKEAGSLRAALARLAATRGRIDKFKLVPVPLQFDMQPALTLTNLISSSRSEVWEGSEFILSCMAYGSPATSFTWYKDGVRIHFNRTERDIWTRTVVEDALGRRLAVLGVGTAARPDSGSWACAASDGGRRRCRALRLAVLRPPRIRLIPPALTLNKGDNASITCLAGASGRVHGALGFSWARERSLLPLAPGREVWEDLYPAGSVLKLYNVQKSAEYRCQVSSVAGTATQGVQVWVAGAGGQCTSAPSHGLRWATTAPGTKANADCPPGYQGQATRYCETKTSTRGVMWALPDFSDCLAEALSDIYDQFVRISYGYSTREVSNVAQLYGGILRNLPALPGGGTKPLHHAIQMLNYLKAPICSGKEKREAVKPLLKIFDMLLAHQDAFLDEQKIFELQSALVNMAHLNDNADLILDQFSIQSMAVHEDTDLRFWFPPRNNSLGWSLMSTSVELLENSGNFSLIVIYYHNLADNLPSLRKATEFRPEGELEYSLVSHHVQLMSVGTITDSSGSVVHPTVVLMFRNTNNHTASGSRFACAVRSASDPGTWNLRACEVRVLDLGQVLCRCHGFGSYGLLVLARSVPSDAESSSRSVVVAAVISGGVLGVLAACAQLPALLRKLRLPTLLRAIFCLSQATATIALLRCDNTQIACGGWGWVCAVCWCVCGAALAAQPLLVQAELAGRTHVHASSVALLGGVCIMAWLIARLSGGAPLHLGSSSQLVCSGGSGLLAVLCLGLALCAALRLRAISNKIPTDRRNFVRNRVQLVHRILVLLVCSGCSQTAAILYVQPGEKHIAVVAVLAASALATGIAMIVCYVVRDAECSYHLRHLFTLNFKAADWERGSDTGNTSLSLFIKHGMEAESRGGVVGSSPQQSASATSYWRAPTPESPTHMHRRQSNPDIRADIVRCVEFKEIPPIGLSPKHYSSKADVIASARSVCDLIPASIPPQPEYMARVCVELGVVNQTTQICEQPLLTCSVDFEPYSDKFEAVSKENCQLCVKSNPDVSLPAPPVIKSCLKKSKISESLSMPSMDMTAEDKKKTSDLTQVNREWNKAYDTPEPSDRVLNKISDDLDFLLNRTQERTIGLDNIEEEPT